MKLPSCTVFVIVFTVFICVVFPTLGQLRTPRCVSSTCCNYCNVTYGFPENSCAQVLEGLAASVNASSQFTFESQETNPYSLYAVHTTVSQCCPPGYIYYEDVTFNMTAKSSTSCSAVGFSVSRMGSCDLGNDQVNLALVVSGSGLSYTGPTINSGCEQS